MTISPILLALCGLLLSALGAVVAGGIAWGRFASALDRLREDHRELRTEVQRAVDAVTGLAIARQRIDTLEAEVKDLRSAKHSHASELAALRAELDGVTAGSASAAGEIDWGPGSGLWELGSNGGGERPVSTIYRAGVEEAVWDASTWSSFARTCAGL